MKQIASIISTYAADVSGVCSALFELGGMTIMHDASGCNSTYNTHDEPRWYDTDSMVYISALSEMEAIMGDDGKLIGDIVDAARELKPRFIAIAGTPIPMMIGTDFHAVAATVEKQTGIPTFGFATNGMHTYARGAGMALEALARRLVKPATTLARKPLHTINILGATPLDYSINGSVESIRALLCANGFEVISCWAMGSKLEELQNAARACVNLVISSSGLPVAKFMYAEYGIPYVVGAPFGEFEDDVIRAIAMAMQSGKSCVSYAGTLAANRADTVIIGESVMSGSLAGAIKNEFGINARVIAAVECENELIAPGGAYACDETDIMPIIKGVRRIIADPLYAPICPDESEFIALPHEGFSGRTYRRDIPNMVSGELKRFMKNK